MTYTPAEWNFTIFFALTCYLVFSVAVARQEKFTFGDCDLHIGAPDFWVFKLAYHVPMLIMFLSFAVCLDLLILERFEKFFGMIFFLPSALWIEDMVYYVFNPFDKPDESESITDALGFFLGIPIFWICGFLYTCLIIYWRLV